MTKTHCGAAHKKEYHRCHTCISCWHTHNKSPSGKTCDLCRNLGCFYIKMEENYDSGNLL